jgi:PAS domain S-box-containing protein
VQDIEQDERTRKANDPRYGGPSFLSLPVMVGGAVTAVMNLAGRPADQPFAVREERLLSLVLREIGIGLENRLLQQRINEQLVRIEAHQAALEREGRERHRTQQALRESEAKFRELVELSRDMIYTTDLEGVFTYVNPVTERLTGYAAAELQGRGLLSLVRPDERGRVEALYRRQVQERLASTYTEFPWSRGTAANAGQGSMPSS